ncbi:trem-like transcript 4 protein [Lepus europaeus]|uniref:trem-like transcript 4 protein n=1 Tax=Lepus europaeus TaxID=9983 RepID=UPI002B487994|nr:trem-like transcript 4 protein [Lepus europaeus]
MAWGALLLLLPGLLLLLAQKPAAQHKLEGEAIYVICPYSADQHGKEKVWCRQAGPNTCLILATSQGWVGSSQCYLWDDPGSAQFTVMMTELKAEDSGFYFCGFFEYSKVVVLGTIQLEVSAAPAPHTPRSNGTSTDPVIARYCRPSPIL